MGPQVGREEDIDARRVLPLCVAGVEQMHLLIEMFYHITSLVFKLTLSPLAVKLEDR